LTTGRRGKDGHASGRSGHKYNKTLNYSETAGGALSRSNSVAAFSAVCAPARRLRPGLHERASVPFQDSRRQMRAIASLHSPSASSAGRSLVALTPSCDPQEQPPCSRLSAAFIAHLVATAQQAPQTRLRRRADPETANAVYAAAAIRNATVGQSLRWSM
jgi:hypothetical protein